MVLRNLCGSLAVGCCVFVTLARDTSALDFSRDIKPLLAEHCLKCHGPDEAEGGLDLSHREGSLKELESGETAIVPGKLEASALIARISSTDPDLRMPPGDAKPLNEEQISLFRRWISEGAEYQIHWSFRTLSKLATPNVSDPSWVKNPIDAFVLAGLDKQSVVPSPEAAPHVLARRLSLDLIGLLPTPEDLKQFVAKYNSAKSVSPAAADKVYEEYVDSLLTSPHFGERWGRHWLDLARYADSDGYEKDRPRPDAYVFRDWVINAFNDNMPFDQFTIEQIAGDLLPNATPSQRIATAFNRQTLTNTEGGTDQEEFRVAAVFDRTDTLGSVWLGMTLGCAKCHTHKYDPIQHTEYYQLFSFFNDADERIEKLPIGAEDTQQLHQELLPLEVALRNRYRELFDEEQAWERTQRELIENGSSSPLNVEKAELRIEPSSKASLTFEEESEGVWSVRLPESSSEANLPDKDRYSIVIDQLPNDVTGFRLEVLPDSNDSKSTVGLAKGGNFVVSNIQGSIVDDQGNVARALSLQKAQADFEQTGFKATDAMAVKPNSKKGWGVSPKVKESHWLQVRTNAPLTLQPNQRVRLDIDQNYGNHHLISRFRVRALTGDANELHLTKEIVNALKMYPEKRTNDTKDSLFDFYMKDDPQVQDLLSKIDKVYQKYHAQVMPVRMIASPRKPRATYRFDRGDFLSPAEEVTPGGLAVLPTIETSAPRGSRLDLARWLVGEQNPLTPRVIVNQFWSRLFGAGIVRSIGDFGARGEVPSHPELLDWLASTYRDELRWDTKQLLKTILMSNTYRQASTHRPELVQRDPLNQWLSRQNRLRVEAELVRDLSLQVSGLLSSKIGGPSVFPPMPAELAKLSYANNFSWSDSKGEDRYRRGMYTFFKRTIPHPTLMTFDCPDANLTCVNRSVSNTPLQALALLNNESFVEASQALAKKLLASAADDDVSRLKQAFLICLTRSPEEEDLERLENLLEHAREFYRENGDDAEAIVGDHAVPGKGNMEVASWIATLRVLMNLDEFITRE